MVESALEDGDITVEFQDFMLEELDNVYSTVSEMKDYIDNIVVAKKRFNKPNFSHKIISFIYSSLIKFVETNNKGIPTSKNFVDNLKGIMRNKTHIHHSHISGEIIGYAHSHCNCKVRENKTKISVIAHNLFRFDFFFLLKGLRAGVWKTRDVCLGCKNLTNMKFANIGNQVTFIDTIKYFQQSLGMLTSNLTDSKKFAIWTECEKFIKKDKKLSKKYNSCLQEDQEWVLKRGRFRIK